MALIKEKIELLHFCSLSNAVSSGECEQLQQLHCKKGNVAFKKGIPISKIYYYFKSFIYPSIKKKYTTSSTQYVL